MKKAAVIVYAVSAFCNLGATVFAALAGNLFEAGAYVCMTAVWTAMLIYSAGEPENK